VDVINQNPKASKKEMAQAMDDVMCRCGTHVRVLKAMAIAAGKMGGKGGAT
jgi:aerobic-type carbon monoxide dehydrogenase small subunit (CoxS/CutS family)